jgi:hypothetical protein
MFLLVVLESDLLFNPPSILDLPVNPPSVMWDLIVGDVGSPSGDGQERFVGLVQ